MQLGWCEISPGKLLLALFRPKAQNESRQRCLSRLLELESCWLHPPQSQKRHSCSLLYWSISISERLISPWRTYAGSLYSRSSCFRHCYLPGHLDRPDPERHNPIAIHGAANTMPRCRYQSHGRPHRRWYQPIL